MANFDTAVSNGTCYWKAGAEAGRDFIPCGNAFAHNINFQCCSVGDVCFDNGACYNERYQGTYLAACTDANYHAPECPDKGNYSNQQWNGLVTCGTSTGQFNKDETWAGCPEPNLDHLSQFTKNCECNNTNPALFTDYAFLVRTAILPMSSGGTIQFINGHQASTAFVTATASATTSATRDLSATTRTSSIGLDETSTPTSEKHSLSTGAKAGIGVGAAGAALLFSFIAVLAWLLRRRRKTIFPEALPVSKPSTHPDATSGGPSSAPLLDPHVTNLGFTGYKAELPADAPLSGDVIISPMSPASPQFHGQQRQYEAYNPDQHSNYLQSAHSSGMQSPRRDTIYGSVLSISPQHTGSSQDYTSAMDDGHAQRPMASIAELQG